MDNKLSDYNNVWIKKGDEWKVAFTTLEGSFKPTVMFFGLTNSSTTFQTIMNEILWDLTNTEKVVSFIDINFSLFLLSILNFYQEIDL